MRPGLSDASYPRNRHDTASRNGEQISNGGFPQRGADLRARAETGTSSEPDFRIVPNSGSHARGREEWFVLKLRMNKGGPPRAGVTLRAGYVSSYSRLRVRLRVQVIEVTGVTSVTGQNALFGEMCCVRSPIPVSGNLRPRAPCYPVGG